MVFFEEVKGGKEGGGKIDDGEELKSRFNFVRANPVSKTILLIITVIVTYNNKDNRSVHQRKHPSQVQNTVLWRDDCSGHGTNILRPTIVGIILYFICIY